MRMIKLLILSVLLVVGASACSNAQSSLFTTEVEKILIKVGEANKDVKSFTQESIVDTEIIMGQGEQKQIQNIDMSMKMDVINEPFTVYQELQTTMPFLGDQTVKQYITQDGIYTNIEDEWVALPEEMHEELIASLKDSANIESQMEQFNDLSEYFELREEKDHYILTADIPGDKIKELALSVIQQHQSLDAEMLATMDQLDIKIMNVEYQIDKDTYHLAGTKIDIELSVEESGEKIEMKMKSDSKVSNINSVKEIVVPQEALNL